MTTDIYTTYIITRTDGKRYIGCTKNWPKRLWEHKGTKRFVLGIKEYRVLFQSSIKLLAEMMETYYVQVLKPELNRNTGW